MTPSSHRVLVRWFRKVARDETFRHFVDSKTFRNPDTDNEVKFDSLPKEEQARIFRRWREQSDAPEKKRRSPRGIVPVDKKRARAKAAEITDSILAMKFRDQDESLWTNRSQPWPVKAGQVPYHDVKGHAREVSVTLDITDHDPEGWKAGRKFVLGGRLQHSHHHEHDRGWASQLTVLLDRSKTPKQLEEGRHLLEDEIYSVLIHELTHAQDHITPAQTKKHRKDRDKNDPSVYYNDPSEVKAFGQQTVDEVEKRLSQIYGDPDPDDPWIPDAADMLPSVLEQSMTWHRVKKHMTPGNRRKLLKSVFDAVSAFRDKYLDKS